MSLLYSGAEVNPPTSLTTLYQTVDFLFYVEMCQISAILSEVLQSENFTKSRF